MPAVTIAHVLLGPLEGTSRHGYDLKQSYDQRFGAASTQDAFLVDYQLFYVEADLRWLDCTESRLSPLSEEVRDVPGLGRA